MGNIVRLCRARRAPRSGVSPGTPRVMISRTRWSALRGPARGAQPSRLDDLTRHGKAAILAQSAQALYNRLVLDFLGGTAIVANHELAFVRMLDIVARDKGAHALDLVN